MVWVTDKSPKFRKKIDEPVVLVSKIFTFEHYRVFVVLNKASDGFYDVVLKSKDRITILTIKKKLGIDSSIILDNDDFYQIVFDTFSTRDDAYEIFYQLGDMILDD